MTGTNDSCIDLVPNVGTDQRLPMLTIECPRGEVIRVYQELPPGCIKDLIEAFFDRATDKH